VESLRPAAMLTLWTQINALWLDFCLTVINDGQAVPAWDVINDAQAGKD